MDNCLVLFCGLVYERLSCTFVVLLDSFGKRGLPPVHCLGVLLHRLLVADMTHVGRARGVIVYPGLKGLKVAFMGLFQHCGRSAYFILTPNKFPHSSPEAPRIIQMRESSTSEGGNYDQ